jgi:N-acetyl-anhydromuramyl-L-alanine amidase AmpD
MKVLRIGSSGEEVKKLQQLLQKAGYTVVVNSTFDIVTEDAVEAFQKNAGLTVDGVVGNMTWTKLEGQATLTPKYTINSTKFVLPTKNYYAEVHPKKAIVLHHTNGHVITKTGAPSMNHFSWWASRDLHVATAYSIDYAGNIYEHFDPQYWAYHLGIGGKLAFLDKQSIGVEITNEGGMKLEDGKYYWATGTFENPIWIPYARTNDQPIHVEGGWRGYEWYAPYSQAQIDATEFLIKYLCKKFNISSNFLASNEYNKDILLDQFRGIYNHANVRKDGKWDLSPAWPFEDFKAKIK